MSKRKQCPQTHVSGSMNAKHAVFCSSRREGIVAFSVLMAQPLVRPFSKQAGWNLRRAELHQRRVIVSEIIKDPVCHMQVSSASFTTEYAGCHYAFCSAQCKERFLASPHLYIGFPGRPAPGEEGKEVIKRHRLLLSAPLDAMQAEQVKRTLLEMMGIHEVYIEGDKIEIQYDLMQVTAEQIADRLTLIGADLGGGWMDRLKLAFINNLEEIEISSLEVEGKNGYHYPL